jgi:uncharacterized protein (DUF1499 family)
MLFKFSGRRPQNLGVKNGKLASCPSSPNCVSSQVPKTDTTHYVAPFPYKGKPALAIGQLKAIVQMLPRTQIITESNNYLYVEFESRLLGYVDDVEFFVDSQEQKVHVRSASRLGESDFGVNRSRIETIRARFR